MGKTYRRDQSHRPNGGKDFKKFKDSNKFKRWNEKPHHTLKPSESKQIEDTSDE